MGVCDEMEITFLSLVLLWIQNYFGLSKLFWSSTNHFGRIQLVLVGYKSYWTGPNHKKLVQKNII